MNGAVVFVTIAAVAATVAVAANAAAGELLVSLLL